MKSIRMTPCIPGNSLEATAIAKWEEQLIADQDTIEMIEETELKPI
jgi:hypothetical protein